eukprot:TRINITY_DN35056_c0_g1_i1.p1 TRINITY_DN35056_c0_g1~~TRINITY_DN35056_c0_g1_i1.p1  ORF type:complete len:228 (+),score=32.07 TRINITY_DN35056_c0_g1_i1:94-777(+)
MGAGPSLKPGQKHFGHCPNCPADQWAQECWNAADDALEADWKARVAASSAASHKQAAQMAALDARQAARRLHEMGAAAALSGSPRLAPYKRFCREVDDYITRHPDLQNDDNWPRYDKFRGFCNGLKAYADVAARAGSLEAANEHLKAFSDYRQVPGSYPVAPDLDPPPPYFGADVSRRRTHGTPPFRDAHPDIKQGGMAFESACLLRPLHSACASSRRRLVTPAAFL